MPSADYNPRMSLAPRSQPQQQKQRREDDGDAFLTLPDKEIAGCISDIGLAFTVDDLRNPKSNQIQRVLEYFTELITNTTREVVAPAMKAAAEHTCGEDADRIFTADTRELMAFFITVRRLLLECGIKDFTFSDIYRPTHPRLVKIFSYIINFIRFREAQTDIIDEHHGSSEKTKSMIQQTYHDNREKADQLEEMEANRITVEQALAEKENRTRELRTRLLELKASQERVTEKLERVRSEQTKLKSLLEDKNVAVMNARQEASKLRPYTEQSPAMLENSLRELSTNLNRDRNEIDRLDKRTRALQTSYDTFNTLITDIGMLRRLLADIQSDLQKEDEELAEANKNREALAEQTNNVREIERQERLLRKQLEQWQARTEKLQEDAEKRAVLAREKMESLRKVHKELSAERKERGEEVEKRRIRIEQTEKKMIDLKENIEREVQAAREEYLKLQSHLHLYITEISGHELMR